MRDRVHHANALGGDLAVECDVVVVGTGAGGAVVGRELAEAGLAVVFVEEGHYFDRKDFTGRAFEMQQKLYRRGGSTFSVGNVGIPIPLGQTVGGTTTVNSGTCYRTPDRVLAQLAERPRPRRARRPTRWALLRARRSRARRRARAKPTCSAATAA